MRLREVDQETLFQLNFSFSRDSSVFSESMLHFSPRFRLLDCSVAPYYSIHGVKI